jgi:catechol 2,3-dioxygenase-like lactoylglutathione lyase family enzyme
LLRVSVNKKHASREVACSSASCYKARRTPEENMIDHLTLRVRDYAKSKAFYLSALKPLGYEQIAEWEGFAGLGVKGKPDLWIAAAEKRKYDQLHLAFRAPNRKAVHAFYEAAIKAGAKDNGGPGTRKDYHPNYYGAFVIDPDGHNLEACCHDPE